MKLAAGLVSAAVAVASIRADSFDLGIIDTKDVPTTSGSSSWNFDWSSGGSSAYSCDEDCPTEYKPVCGTDGVTYDNDCAFTVAQCNATDLAVASTGKCSKFSSPSPTTASSPTFCPDVCLDVHKPVRDENGQVYSNECYLQRAKCKGSKKPVDLLVEYKSLYGSGAGSDKSGSDSSASKTPPSSTESSKSTTPEFCPDACLAVMDPVTDENGVEYSSPCHMAMAKCSGKKMKNEDPLALAESLYGPLFVYSDSESTSGSSFDESASDESSGSLSSATKLVKATKAPAEDITKTPATKAGQSSKTSGSIGSLFDDNSSSGMLGSANKDRTLIKGLKNPSGSEEKPLQHQQQQQQPVEKETAAN